MGHMMTTFFISDTHFGHANIIKFCPATRPYADIDEMEESLISQWNERVTDDDVIYHLGDVFYKNNHANRKRIFDKLNGKKRLIVGNHDDTSTRRLDWETVSPYEEFYSGKELFVLCHYPIASWKRKSKGSVHLYGHVHGKSPIADVPNAFEVGIEGLCVNGPISESEILSMKVAL